MDKHPILIAEDDEDLLTVLDLLLQDYFTVTSVSDGEKAIDAIKDNAFHFIVIDVHLPSKSGIEICEFVKSLPPKDRPSVVVLSGDTSDLTIKKAFASGAGDYITKPFNVVAFHERLMSLSRDILQIQSMQNKDEKARSLADTAMKQASGYGSGLELIARLNQCATVEKMMEKCTKGLLAQGYQCSVEFRSQTNIFNYDVDTGECKDNEKKVFELLHDKGRIYQFGKRTIFNDHNASLLIKNMPTEGTSSYDTAIDLFAKLVPALRARFDALDNVQKMIDSRDQLNNSIELVSAAIRSMEVERRESLEEIAAAIGVSFHELDLTEEQERFFLDLIEKKLSTNKSNDRFNDVVTMLKNAAESLQSEISINEETEEDDETLDDDMELF